ncbi:MAG: ribbon-helix-helix protein, CopG family [Acidimicrobiales bacterium]
MAHPMSVRFQDPAVLERLKTEAEAAGCSSSALAEELIDEGLRLRRHPLITFRKGPSGRRAALKRGPDVWEAIGGIVGGDVPVSERIDRAVDLFGLSRQQVDAALAYYAEFTDEIDARIASNMKEADEGEALWHRQRDLLAK